ncbi:hypothetical protein MKLM6_1557 [Methylomonas koyamae]|nr:hypothetical protein MKLM6_1557 [Methylomonas koyamae]
MSESMKGVPKSLEDRQKVVIDGLTYFATKNFTGAFTPALDFLERIYAESFPRSSKVDEMLVDGFLKAISIREPNEDLVRFYDSFIKQVLPKYDPHSGGDKLKFGHGSSTFQIKVLKTAETIRRAVNDYISRNPDKKSLLTQHDGSLEAFNSALLSIESKFLDSPHSPVQYAYLEVVDKALPEVSDQSITDSELMKGVFEYSKNNRERLNEPEKNKIGAIYTNLISHSPEIRKAAFSSLTEKAPYRGKSDVPLWATFNDETVVSILDKLESQTINYNDKKEIILFLAEVAGQAGSSRTRKTGYEVGTKATYLAERVLRDTESQVTRHKIMTEFAAASEKIKIHYPKLANDIDKRIQIASQSITW